MDAAKVRVRFKRTRSIDMSIYEQKGALVLDNTYIFMPASSKCGRSCSESSRSRVGFGLSWVVCVVSFCMAACLCLCLWLQLLLLPFEVSG